MGVMTLGILLPIRWLRQRAIYVFPHKHSAHGSLANHTVSTLDALIFLGSLSRRHMPPHLSFNNIIEAYTLRALRTKHKVSIEAAREAIDFAERTFSIDRLFICPELRTGAGELFLEQYGGLIKLNEAGQRAMKLILKDHLNRIELDDLHIPARLYPATTDTKIIMMDPRIAFGRPIIARRGNSTAAIINRINAHESEKEIAEDYGLTLEEANAALVYEQAA